MYHALSFHKVLLSGHQQSLWKVSRPLIPYQNNTFLMRMLAKNPLPTAGAAEKQRRDRLILRFGCNGLGHPRPIDRAPLDISPSSWSFYLRRRYWPHVYEAFCPLAPGVYLVVMGTRWESSTLSDEQLDQEISSETYSSEGLAAGGKLLPSAASPLHQRSR
jgi:hypothetical protein